LPAGKPFIADHCTALRRGRQTPGLRAQGACGTAPASGGIGRIACSIVRRRGMEVIAGVSSISLAYKSFSYGFRFYSHPGERRRRGGAGTEKVRVCIISGRLSRPRPGETRAKTRTIISLN